jgi:hypothetical protein
MSTHTHACVCLLSASTADDIAAFTAAAPPLPSTRFAGRAARVSACATLRLQAAEMFSPRVFLSLGVVVRFRGRRWRGRGGQREWSKQSVCD